MKSLAQITVGRPKLVLLVSLFLFVLAGVLGSAVIPKMSGGGYDDSAADSAIVAQALESDFGVVDPHLSIAVGKAGVSNAALNADVASVADQLFEEITVVPGVDRIETFWNDAEAVNYVSADQSLGLILVYVEDKSLDAQNAVAKEIIENTPTQIDDVEIYIGGTGAIYNAINGQITEDIAFAESISIPLTLLMLLFVFGTAVAASMPLIVGLFAISGALFGVWAVSNFTDVSVFALNLITGLGLGLGIDYALLIVNRFREELARLGDVEDAVRATVHTAGRTVLFSGLTVALTLSSLFVFPQQFLRSFAFAGVLVCLMAVVGALIPLPAALRLLGHRIDKGRVRRGDLTPSDEGFWSRTASAVMHRPFLVSFIAITLLIGAGSLALDAKFGQVDDRVLPANNPAAVASEIFREYFNSYEASPVEVLIPKGVETTSAYASAVNELTGVVRVETESGIYNQSGFIPLGVAEGWPYAEFSTADYDLVRVIVEVEPRSIAGEDFIADIRAINPDVSVGGAAAIYADSQAGIADNVLNALIWVAITTLVLLFLFTGSVLLPIKAVLLNLLSLSATIGVLTWMFQNGNLQWLTGEYTVTGQLDTSSLVLIIIVTFGLSMDYEVFLLSRIKEEHDAGADTRRAVALGLQRSGRIITAAAALLAVVFAAFVTSSVTSVKMLGFGIGFAILLDATVVRGLLVPALMRIAGKYNWWAPRPLVWVHKRFGISD